MPAVTVREISKEYVLGERERGQETFREMVAGALLAPYRRFRHLAGDAPRERRFFALKDVSFDVQPGEVLGIIGRNGAGKSTLLKILSRITVPTEGRAELTGRTSSLLEVGTGFHPELTGRENIFLNGAILGMRRSEIRRKFDEIVAFSEVERFLDTPVKRYSSGMYVRLAFAVAAHMEPEILIVDEVLAVGDAQFQRKCLGRMGAIGREGRTILLVSHNMQVIQSLCGRAIWLEGGRVAYDGPARSAVVEYAKVWATEVVERHWDDPEEAPGNDVVRLLAARIVPLSGGAGELLTVKTPFRLEFVYRVNVSGMTFFPGVHLRTVNGEVVFATAAPPRVVGEGRYRSSCLVPGDLLNNGTYTLDLFLARDGNVILYKSERPLTFEVHDAEREPRSFLGELPGAVRPQLQWDVERLP